MKAWPIFALLLMLPSSVLSQSGPRIIRFQTVAVGDSDAIVIPCHVIGRHGTAWTICLIDTGASNTVVDSVFSRKDPNGDVVNVLADGSKVNIHRERQTMTLPTIDGGDLRYSTRVGVMKLRIVVPGVGAILGEDFLRRYKSVHIDYAHRLLILD